MSDAREPMHQPPNPADLRRAPPGSPECARVRGWLRDYVDGDLAGAGDLARRVEEHVHLCRGCGLELARAEHEVLQLRMLFRGLAGSSQQVDPGEQIDGGRGPRPGFARRVIDRLVRDDTSIGSPAEAGGGADADEAARADRSADDAAVGSQRGAMAARVLVDEVVDDTLRSTLRNAAAGSPLGMLIASMLLLVALGVGVRYFATANDAPAHLARLIVLRADGTFDSSRQPLGGGDILGDSQSLRVVRGGLARLDWHDPSARRQPAATLEVEGGEVRLENGAPMLVNGKLLVETKREVDIPMADGSRLELGVGEYVIAAEIPADMLDNEAMAPGEDPLSVLPGDLRIQVEVRSGAPARIVRVGAAGALVAAGQVGIYRGTAGVAVHATGDPSGALDPGSIRVAAENNAPPQPQVVGHVVDPVGLPSVGAAVYLSTAVQGHKMTFGDVTGVDGRFVMPTSAACDGDFAVVLALPAPALFNLGLAAPQAVPVERHGDAANLVRPIRFEQSTPLHGVVRDQNYQLRTGVQVIPCVVDELFGSVLALPTSIAQTDALGTFHIDQLPARLPAHQSLVLVFSHPALEATVVPVPVRGSVVATPDFGAYIVRQLRTVSVAGLPAGAAVTIYEEVLGLPAGTAAVKRRVNAGSDGIASQCLVGRGALWLRSGSSGNPTVRRLELTGIGPIPRYEPTGPTHACGEQFRSLTSLADSSIDLQSAFRHERFVTAQVANAVAGQALRVADEWGHGLAEAQVFAVEATGPRGAPDPLFLGFTSLVGGLSLAGLSPTASLVVIGPGGEVGQIGNPTGGDQVVQLTLQANGRVLLHPSLRPAGGGNAVVPIRFRVDDGPAVQPAVVRFAGPASGWEVGDLVPGSYFAEVNGVARAIQVPSGGFVVLQ